MCGVRNSSLPAELPSSMSDDDEFLEDFVEQIKSSRENALAGKYDDALAFYDGFASALRPPSRACASHDAPRAANLPAWRGFGRGAVLAACWRRCSSA